MRSERLLVSMKDYIGDAVMSEPMLAAVEQLFARVEMNAGSPVDQVLWRPGPPRRFVETPRPRRLWNVVENARLLRSRSYDVAILVNRSFRSALTARLAGIRTRIGHGTEGRAPLLTRSLPYDRERFEVLSYFELASLAGVESPPRAPVLSATQGEQEEGALLAEGATVGVQPGARWLGKQLPPAVSIAVSRSLIESGHKVALLGAASEAPVAQEVARALGSGFVNLVGCTSVRQTMGIFTRLKAVVGSDTGLMHLAAGIGCPTITVFGPSQPSKWGHDYPPHRIVRAPNGDMTQVDSAQLTSLVLEVLSQT